jgi:hypothetical protein
VLVAGQPVQQELLASDPWTARMLIADRFASGRVFLVGESAAGIDLDLVIGHRPGQ